MSSSISVHELVLGFQRALVALVPVAESIGVPWREPDNYDGWDVTAEGIFSGFVSTAIDESKNARQFGTLGRYDYLQDDYSKLSFIAVLSEFGPLPFVRFETALQPFDTCVFAKLIGDARLAGYGRIPVRECRFALLGRNQNGTTEVVETLHF